MRVVFTVFNIVNTVVILGLMVYFPLVHMNLIFTNNFVTVLDIPYYDPLSSSTSTDRYNFNWWLFATDVLKIIPVPMSLYTIADASIYGADSVLFYALVMTSICVIEFIKLFYFAIRWAACGGYQFCRDFDPVEDPSDANYVFLSEFWFTTGFLILFVIMTLLGNMILEGSINLKKTYGKLRDESE